MLMTNGLWAQSAFETGVKAYNDARFDDAQQAFSTHLKKAPQDLATRIYLIDIQAQRQQWEKAWKAYATLAQSNPSHAELAYKASGALAMFAKTQSYWFQFSHREEIKAGFLKALTLNPHFVDAHWAMIEYGLAVPGWLGGGVDLSQKHANKLVQISPVDGYLSSGRIAVYQQEWQIAQRNYEKAFEVGKSLHTFTTLKQFYIQRNLTQQAKALDQTWAQLAKKY